MKHLILFVLVFGFEAFASTTESLWLNADRFQVPALSQSERDLPESGFIELEEWAELQTGPSRGKMEFIRYNEDLDIGEENAELFDHYLTPVVAAHVRAFGFKNFQVRGFHIYPQGLIHESHGVWVPFAVGIGYSVPSRTLEVTGAFLIGFEQGELMVKALSWRDSQPIEGIGRYLLFSQQAASTEAMENAVFYAIADQNNQPADAPEVDQNTKDFVGMVTVTSLGLFLSKNVEPQGLLQRLGVDVDLDRQEFQLR